MLLATTVLPKADLARLIASITPCRVTIDPERGRAVSLDRPTLDLVPGQGIRLRGSGVVSWDFARVPVPVRVNRWQILFVPRVGSRRGAHVLSLEARLEDLDVKLIPGFVDEKIATAIRRAITEHQNRLAWDFGRTLSKGLPLTPKFSPRSVFSLLPAGGEASVHEREVRLVLRFEARFQVGPGLEQTPVAGTEGEAASAREEVSRVSRAVRPPPRPQPARHLPHKLPPPARPAKSRTLRRPAPPPRTGRIV
jgi:hypothetical protein